MNQHAAVRTLSAEPELQILPLERTRDRVGRPGRLASRRDPLSPRAVARGLRRAFGVRPSVAILGDSDSILAACLLAPGGNPIRRSLISLPYSDFCPPLAENDSARDSLMTGLAGTLSRTRLEIRGAAAPVPGRSSITSSAGRSICRSRSRLSSAPRIARSDADCVAPARPASASNVPAAPRRSKASSGSSSRAGVVSGFRRSRSNFSGWCTKSLRNSPPSRCGSLRTRASASPPLWSCATATYCMRNGPRGSPALPTAPAI